MMYSAQQMGGNQFSGAGQGQLSVVLQDLAARFVLTCPPEEFESFNRIFFSIEVRCLDLMKSMSICSIFNF